MVILSLTACDILHPVGSLALGWVFGWALAYVIEAVGNFWESR